MSYAECLQKYYNAVDGTFYDAINVGRSMFDVQSVRLSSFISKL